ncbi:MAG TPA: tetratricopeptide repeat protein [Pseudolabrys sp.]|nr:tetratricopeptide repeat protein [Pseudolabrys sp.]
MMAMQPTANEKQRAQAQMLQQANSAIQNERPIEAERLAREILKANSGHSEAIKILGYALLMQGKAEDAVAPLEKAARASHDPEIATQLAIALRQAGETDRALIWLKRAVKRTPPFAAAFHELGYLLHSLDRSEEAIEVLVQGMAVAPMMTEMPIQLGFVCYAMNDRANAGSAFARALSINPVHPEAIHGLATVLIEEGEFAQAAELFKRALSVNADDAPARIGLGNCLLELGQAEAAYACLRAASARSSDFYGKALRVALSSGHGRFWLRPSAAAKFLKGD